MGLRELAEQDAGFILSGDAFGFRWPLIITDPDGHTAGGVTPFYGFSNDVAQAIDPDTGQLVHGRVVHAVVALSDLTAAGFTSIPRAIEDQAAKPWRFDFADINGVSYTFKVRQADPDRALGVLSVVLEGYDK